MKNTIYCPICHSNEIEHGQEMCPKCKEILETVIPRAFKLWDEAINKFGACCCGLFGGKFGEAYHLQLHSDEFDSSYPEDASGDEPDVFVEVDACFYADYVEFSYRFEQPTSTDSFDYAKLDYPEEITAEWWEEFEKLSKEGAKAAWNSDTLSCPECGYHYSCQLYAECPTCAERKTEEADK